MRSTTPYRAGLRGRAARALSTQVGSGFRGSGRRAADVSAHGPWTREVPALQQTGPPGPGTQCARPSCLQGRVPPVCRETVTARAALTFRLAVDGVLWAGALGPRCSALRLPPGTCWLLRRPTSCRRGELAVEPRAWRSGCRGGRAAYMSLEPLTLERISVGGRLCLSVLCRVGAADAPPCPCPAAHIRSSKPRTVHEAPR